MRLTYVGGMYVGSDQRAGAVGPRATCSEIPQTASGQSEDHKDRPVSSYLGWGWGRMSKSG